MKNKKLLIGLAVGFGLLIICCLCTFVFLIFFSESETGTKEDSSDVINVAEVMENAEECDTTLNTGNYLDYHGVEKLFVSVNPCEVMWLLAQSYDEYELTTANGKTMYVIVWQDYANNVDAASSFTIRALDVKDDGISNNRDNASVAIVRWVSDVDGLGSAKAEVEDAVNNLEL